MLNACKLAALGLLLAATPALAGQKAPTRLSVPQFKAYAQQALAQHGIKAEVGGFAAINSDDTRQIRGVLVKLSRARQLNAAYRLLTGKPGSFGDSISVLSRARGVNLKIVTRAGWKAMQDE